MAIDQPKEWLRHAYITGSGLLGPLASDELSRARFFIDTMEEFIASSESEEIKALEAEAGHLDKDAKDEYWQWHYPIHWQDIFGVRIRSAFLAQLCSYLEAIVGDVAHRVQVIQRNRIEPRHLKGATVDKHKLYLEAVGGFEQPTTESWKKIGFLFRMRNAHVHEQGYVGENLRSDREFGNFVSGLPGVATDNDFIELRAGSCVALLAVVQQFDEQLRDEYERYRHRQVS